MACVSDRKEENMTEEELIRRIREKTAGVSRGLITIDGPCATGKTTMAGRIGAAVGAWVLHTDDFVIPHREKTAERLAIPGGNSDTERIVREIIAPWKAGEAVRYRRYNFMEDRMREAEEIPAGYTALILEGSYCNMPGIREAADIRIFVEAGWSTREARLRERESPESLARFYSRWIPLEDDYFAAYGLPDEGCIRIDGGGFSFPGKESIIT